MEQEIKEMLSEALPLLKEFKAWKAIEAEKERIRQEIESESEKEFKAWCEQRQKVIEQQEKDSAELEKMMC